MMTQTFLPSDDLQLCEISLSGLSQEIRQFIEAVVAALPGEELRPRTLKGDPLIADRLYKLLKDYSIVYYDSCFPEELKWLSTTINKVPKMRYTFYVRRK